MNKCKWCGRTDGEFKHGNTCLPCFEEYKRTGVAKEPLKETKAGPSRSPGREKAAPAILYDSSNKLIDGARSISRARYALLKELETIGIDDASNLSVQIIPHHAWEMLEEDE